MQIPAEWILGAIGSLGCVIAAVSSAFAKFVNSRFDAQDKIIASQNRTIAKLQNDIERLGKGCGHQACLWKNR